MLKLKAKTIRRLVDKTLEINKDKQLPRHHLIWILERIAGQGDGYLPKELDKIVEEDIQMVTMTYKELKEIFTDKQIGQFEVDGSIEWIEHFEHFWIHDHKILMVIPC